jgi:hypothetical protein
MVVKSSACFKGDFGKSRSEFTSDLARGALNHTAPPKPYRPRFINAAAAIAALKALLDFGLAI